MQHMPGSCKHVILKQSSERNTDNNIIKKKYKVLTIYKIFKSSPTRHYVKITATQYMLSYLAFRGRQNNKITEIYKF